MATRSPPTDTTDEHRLRDLYEILGVSRDASEDDIKRAYRKLAREHHPDTGGDENEFKELTTAYEVLMNPQARANYDRFGDPRGPQDRMGAPGGDPFGGGFGDLSDLIDAFFGGGGFGGGGSGGSARARPQSGRDAVVDVRLTLEEALTGTEREVQLQIAKPCETCDGSGAQPGSGPTRCDGCDGQGAVQQVRNSVFGQMVTQSVCPRCRGTGSRITDPCGDCRGEGRRQVTETVTVDVPAGVDNGQRLRLAGRGEAGRLGSPSGDLYVRVHVAPHEIFERDGNDLHCHVRVPMVQAALGVELPLPTLDGEISVEVPPGTQPGDVMTVRRKGMPKVGGGGARGDLHVHCDVEVPRRLSDDERTLLESFAEQRGEDRPLSEREGRGIFSRLKEAFGG